MVILDGWPINGRWQMGPGACRFIAALRIIRKAGVGDLVWSSASNRDEALLQNQTGHLALLLLSAVRLMHTACPRAARWPAPGRGKMRWLQRLQAANRRVLCERNGGLAGSRIPAKPNRLDRHEAYLPGFAAKVWRDSPLYGDRTFHRD